MVGLFHFRLLEHGVQSCQCLGGSGEDDDAADGSVEPVHHAEEDVARFGIFFLDILFHSFAQRLVAGFVALHDFACGFVDNDQVIVFVENVHLSFSVEKEI